MRATGLTTARVTTAGHMTAGLTTGATVATAGTTDNRVTRRERPQRATGVTREQTDDSDRNESRGHHSTRRRVAQRVTWTPSGTTTASDESGNQSGRRPQRPRTTATTATSHAAPLQQRQPQRVTRAPLEQRRPGRPRPLRTRPLTPSAGHLFGGGSPSTASTRISLSSATDQLEVTGDRADRPQVALRAADRLERARRPGDGGRAVPECACRPWRSTWRHGRPRARQRRRRAQPGRRTTPRRGRRRWAMPAGGPSPAATTTTPPRWRRAGTARTCAAARAGRWPVRLALTRWPSVPPRASPSSPYARSLTSST